MYNKCLYYYITVVMICGVKVMRIETLAGGGGGGVGGGEVSLVRVLIEWIRRRYVTGTSTIRQLRSPGPSPFRCKNGLLLERRRARFSVFSDYKTTAERLKILYCLKKKSYYRRRRYWIHVINLQRETYGEFYRLVDEVLIDEEKVLMLVLYKHETMYFPVAA